MYVVGWRTALVLTRDFLCLFPELRNNEGNKHQHDTRGSAETVRHEGTYIFWRHNRLPMTSQRPDNCDAITWIMISNSLDIDFI